MILKLIGVILTVFASGLISFQIAANYIKEIKQVKKLIYVLTYMESELTYRRTPLPELFLKLSINRPGVLGSVFEKTGKLLEAKLNSSVESCIGVAIDEVEGVSKSAVIVLNQLAANLGKFDVEGQVNGIRSVAEESRSILKSLEENKTEKLRGIKTLGVCAGAAVAILLI